MKNIVRGTIDYPTFDVNEDAELEVTITDGRTSALNSTMKGSF